MRLIWTASLLALCCGVIACRNGSQVETDRPVVFTNNNGVTPPASASSSIGPAAAAEVIAREPLPPPTDLEEKTPATPNPAAGFKATAAPPETSEQVGAGDSSAQPVPTVDATGFLRLPGGVRVHLERQLIEVDGVLNLNYGYLEFLACEPGVKRHETLVGLDVDPIVLNAALLSIGLKPSKPPENDADLRPIAGERVIILLRWKVKNAAGEEVVVEKRAEDCIVNLLAGTSMERTGWVYTGSLELELDPQRPPVDEPRRDAREESPKDVAPPPLPDSEVAPAKERVYAAAYFGFLISLVHRPFAILDNPVELPYPDPEYGADPEVLPAVDFENPPAVTLTIRRPLPGEIDEKIVRMTITPREPPKGADREPGSEAPAKPVRDGELDRPARAAGKDERR
ncbi:MAG: YdjY domain-containing protein [Planctomycetota bacterium]